MTAELSEQFAKIQKYSAALREILVAAQTCAPRRAEGSAGRGAVAVSLGPDGAPASFRVARDWKRRIGPEYFAQAVLEACQVATGRRLAAWTRTLEDKGWKARIDELAAESGHGSPNRSDEPGGIPVALRPSLPSVQPRRLHLIAEDVIRSFGNVRRSPPSAPESGTGSGGRGNLTLTLSSVGATSCTAGPRWVVRQTAASLMTALSEALAAAKEDLAAKIRKEPAQPTGLDGLLAEVMALLNDPQRFLD